MRKLLIIWLLAVVGVVCNAQTDSLRHVAIDNDSLFVISSDSALLRDLAPLDTVAVPDSSLYKALQMTLKEDPATTTKKKRDWSTWTPDPKRALWLALVIPGGGQIYNRKYWKLPIIYGGIGAGIGLGTYYTLQYKNSVKAHDASLLAYNEAFALDPNTTLTVSPVNTRAKTLGICMFGMAAAVYWASLLDGATYYKKGVFPNAGRATIYSILLPGLGQAYNREYWKIPIYWGALAGATHFLVTNDINYKRYKRIHNEATSPDKTYTGPISAETAVYYRDVFRRYRDYSIVALVGFYLLQVIDANVFSYMLDFDMSNDLSLHMEPAVIMPDTQYAFSPKDRNAALGFSVGLRF